MAGREEREEEIRNFWRSPELPGFELIDAPASTAPWQVYNVQYAIAIPVTWAAPINHEGRLVDLSPGHALMLRPGEFHTSPGAQQPGHVRAIKISDDALQRYAGEYLTRPTELEWKANLVRCSGELVEAFHRVYAVLQSAPTAMQLQSTMVHFFAVMVRELVAGSKATETPATSCKAAQMRELMHHAPDGLTLGLEELAAAVGLTRFQALRAFKRKYGLPPHAYQLTVRVSLGLNLLRSGESVTRVAHETGFTDQSHFTRHFKRIWSITPGQYARSAWPILSAKSAPCISQSDGITYSS